MTPLKILSKEEIQKKQEIMAAEDKMIFDALDSLATNEPWRVEPDVEINKDDK